MTEAVGAPDAGSVRLRLLGLALDNLTLDEAVVEIQRALEQRRRGFVVTPNVDHIVRAARDARFRAVCDAAAWSLADGMPLVWASRLMGTPLRGRVAGSDLVPALCRMAARRGFSVFVLGGGEGVASQAASRLAATEQGLRVAGTLTPPAGFTPDDQAGAEAVAAVNRVAPDILFVGLGSPKQEFLVHRHWESLRVTVAVCCGAAIDYAAGVKPRAPASMQRLGLEWAWRLGHEPRRLWRRYLVEDPAFLGIVLREWWRLRVKKSSG